MAPDHEYPSFLLLEVEVVDSLGLASKKIRSILPVSSIMTFLSVPTGADIALFGVPRATPFDFTVIIGSANSLALQRTQSIDGQLYEFDSWG